jgi:DNA-binding NtrC family response regulator
MKKKILIVEDEFVVANDLAIMLEASGYETLGIAVSARAAMDEISKTIPDLVLLDIRLQGPESGIDLATKLKTLHIAFVYLSANSDQATLQRAKATEPYGFLVKPVRSKDLLVTLEIACYRHEHSLESFLFRKDRLRRELLILTGEQGDRATTLSRFAASLQLVVPFDLLCFAWATGNTAHRFRGLFRVGFNEYQEIDKTGLINIAAKTQAEVDPLLSGPLGVPGMQSFAAEAYTLFLAEDPLAGMLDHCYHFQAAVRGAIELPALANCKMYIFNRGADQFDDRHLSVLEGMQNLIGKLLKGLDQEEKSTAAGIQTDQRDGDLVFGKFIGKSKAISHCLDLVAQVAPADTSVLITGESGTGKELFAEAIHELSPRNRQPFIKINCAALPSTLIESELFGYEKGAFTGAMTSRIGKFEAASGGTIFLDEIGEMDLEVQAKILRVLQEKEVQRVGSNKVIKADVRIIAATNSDLEKAVAEHRFRLDLYFRLNVFPIRLPPLRDRKEDIDLLAGHLGKQIARTMGWDYCGITGEMMNALKQYDWPGNVRELENVIERALITSGPNRPMTLPQPLTGLGTPVEPITAAGKFITIDEIKQRQEQFERALIVAALREAKGKVRGPGGAAEKLDIKPTTLESKCIRLGINKEDFK